MLPKGSPMRGAKLAQSGFSCYMIYLHFESEKLRTKKRWLFPNILHIRKNIIYFKPKKCTSEKYKILINLSFYLIYWCNSKTELLPIPPSEWWPNTTQQNALNVLVEQFSIIEKTKEWSARLFLKSIIM